MASSAVSIRGAFMEETTGLETDIDTYILPSNLPSPISCRPSPS